MIKSLKLMCALIVLLGQLSHADSTEKKPEKTEPHPREKLSFWMTHEQVRVLLPHEVKLSGFARKYDPEPTPEQIRVDPMYSVNLVDTYGLDLGFNKAKKLVQIMRVEKADIKARAVVVPPQNPQSHREKISFWMSYEDVRLALPHDPKELGMSPDATGDSPLESVYGVVLDDRYGLRLGFNSEKKLVWIMQIESAK